jgi:hypothetical protein
MWQNFLKIVCDQGARVRLRCKAVFFSDSPNFPRKVMDCFPPASPHFLLFLHFDPEDWGDIFIRISELPEIHGVTNLHSYRRDNLKWNKTYLRLDW